MHDAADVHEPAATRHRPSTLTVFGAAFVAGAVAAFGINSVLDSHLVRSQPQVECEPIFVALRSLPQGTPVTVWDVALRDWPRAMLPQTALRAEDTFEGRILRHPLREGQPLLSVQLAEVETAEARRGDGPLTTSALAAAVEEAFAPPVPATAVEAFAPPVPATTPAPGAAPPTATTGPAADEVFVAVEPLESAATSTTPLIDPPTEAPVAPATIVTDSTPFPGPVAATTPPTPAALADAMPELADPPTFAIEAPDVAGDAFRTEAAVTPDPVALAQPIGDEPQPVTHEAGAADGFSTTEISAPGVEESETLGAERAVAEAGGNDGPEDQVNPSATSGAAGAANGSVSAAAAPTATAIVDVVAAPLSSPVEAEGLPASGEPTDIASDPAAPPAEFTSPPVMAVTPLPAVTETAAGQRLVPLAPAPSTDIEGPLATLSRQRAAQTAASQPGSVIAAVDPLDTLPTPTTPATTPADPRVTAKPTPTPPAADASATVKTSPTAPSAVAADVSDWSTATASPAAPAPAAIPTADPTPSAGREAAGPPPLRHLVVPERIAMQADTSFVVPQRPTATATEPPATDPASTAPETASMTPTTTQGTPSSTAAPQAAAPRTPHSPAEPRPLPMANQHFPHPQRASSAPAGRPQPSRHPQSQRRPDGQQRPAQSQAQSQRSWSDGPVLRAIGGLFQGLDGSGQGGGSRTR